MIKTENTKRKTENEINCLHFPFSISRFPVKILAVDRGGDDDGDADHYRTDHDAERGILIFLDLLVNVKHSAQDKISDGKENYADRNENQRRYQNFKQLV
jgi:hypothetical protein